MADTSLNGGAIPSQKDPMEELALAENKSTEKAEIGMESVDGASDAASTTTEKALADGKDSVLHQMKDIESCDSKSSVKENGVCNTADKKAIFKNGRSGTKAKKSSSTKQK